MHASTFAPPPWPEPLHWFTVNAVAGAGAFALMLLTMSTVQMVALPPALSESLHWCTALMTSLELEMSPVHPFRVHVRRYTTAEVPPVASMVLTIETEQVTESAAPPGGPDSWPLHCEKE